MDITRRIMPITTRLRVITLFLAAPLVLCAQDPNASQAELIRTLLARIDKLEKRVTELESKNAPPPEAALTPQSPVTLPSPHEHEPKQGATGAPSLRLAGFTDLNFSATDQRGARSGFNEGQFI